MCKGGQQGAQDTDVPKMDEFATLLIKYKIFFLLLVCRIGASSDVCFMDAGTMFNNAKSVCLHQPEALLVKTNEGYTAQKTFLCFGCTVKLLKVLKRKKKFTN